MNRTMLGARGPHVYVTRAATLEYQRLTGTQFETARKALTNRLLSAAPDPNNPGCFLVPIQSQFTDCIRVYTTLDGGLLAVPKIEAL